jgi:hypothetical protein
MEKATLENYISQGFSTYDIAKAEGCGQTNVRHWLRKFGLNTKSKKEKNILKGKTTYSNNANNYLKQRERANVRKKEIVKIKGGCCSLCGYKKNIAALQFHHRDPFNKTFTLDARKLSNTNWNSILLELEKCDLLCANCHAEIHYPDLEMVVGAGNAPEGVEHNKPYEGSASTCQPPPTIFLPNTLH